MSASAVGGDSRPRGRREQSKAANRAEILRAAREVFGQVGYGAASVRDIIRRTELASGTFYNYFPDKESVFRALVEELTIEGAALAHAARVTAPTMEGFVEAGFRAFFAFIAEDPDAFEFIRRNAGTVRQMFDGAMVGATVDELAEDLHRGVEAGLLPPHDVELTAAAMLGAAFETGIRAAERQPVDVAGATRVCTDIFLGGFERLRGR